tara:strand:- start:1585 stop:2040 length:456 start_codon:yes stop_codon:yes gene_type:complete
MSKQNKILLILFLSCTIYSQIEKQVRDDNPGLFKNQRVYHSSPTPLFKERSHNLDFITSIPKDSILSSTLFFKTNTMEHYQEFQLNGTQGLYRFIYDPKKFPGTHIQYYFIITTHTGAYGAPINDLGELIPINKLLVNPVEYFKQQARLNK